MKTFLNIQDLRNQFEYEFKSRYFYLDRQHSGEYRNPLTFQAWCAYKLCASLNGVIDPNFDIYSKEAQ